PPALARLAAEARAVAARYPGAVVEDKGSTLALHWRGAPDAAAAFHALAMQGLASLPHYRPQPGKQVLELRPDGFDKGSAIAELMRHAPFAGRRPVFVGDDLTDEHGFIAVNALHGVSVLVGDRAPTDATHRIEHPQALRDWLHVAASRLPYQEATA
ncbi:MAG TPA: trehalose-phosphatase, partial [Lysobacter sp.]